MKNIAIITGGPSAERGIALKSAQLVQQYLSPEAYKHTTILLESDGWYDQDSGQVIDLNDFSLTTDGIKSNFDFVFLMIHGTPVEDGKLQGYFESKGIPHSTCSTLTSALTFNKQWCKNFLRAYDVPMARSIVVRARDIDGITTGGISYPVFVKPNNNGSSYGISRVTQEAALDTALKLAARFDDEIMIEEELAGREFSCGVLTAGGEVHVLPLTEMLPDGEFFDYAAKYEGAGKEITPAELEPDLTRQCQDQSARLYHILDCKGVVRFDYILVDQTFHLLEVNTVPGMSEASIIPQQAIAYGWTIGKLLEAVVEDCMGALQP